MGILPSKFKAIAFYTGKHNLPHFSFVHEANRWLPVAARQNGFSCDSTNNWSNLKSTIPFPASFQASLQDAGYWLGILCMG